MMKKGSESELPLQGRCLESQRDLIDAQTTQIEAVTEYNISLARLEKTQGTLLLKNNIKIEDDEIFTGSNNISN